MLRLDEGDRRRALEGKVGVEDVAAARHQGCRIGPDINEAGWLDCDHRGFGNAGARSGEQGDPMPKRRQPSHQRHYNALRATILPHREPVVRGDRDVQWSYPTAQGVARPAGSAPVSST